MMMVNRAPIHLPPRPVPGPLTRLNSVELGAPAVDLPMGLAYLSQPNLAVSGLGLGIAGLHAMRGAAFLMGARHETGARLRDRLGIAGGEALLAGGHALGALGAGAYALPLLVAGTAVTEITDYRYHTDLNMAEDASGPIRLKQLGADAADATLGLGYSCAWVRPAGVAAGAVHGAMAAYDYLNGDPSTKHARHCAGFGQALLAAGHLAGAAGAGGWALAPLAAGMIITTLQDHRDH